MKTATKSYRYPDWLYNAFPYLYIASGILVIFALGNIWGIFSGAVLLSAGASVFYMRITHRKDLDEKGINNWDNDILEIETLDSGAAQLIWSKQYESGNSSIDAQHRKLFELGNTLLGAIHREDQYSLLNVLVDRLLGEVETHFSSEEALLSAWGHPLTEEHKKAHQKLLKKAFVLRDNLEIGRLSYEEMFAFFVNDLVLQHIIQEDKKFFYQI